MFQTTSQIYYDEDDENEDDGRRNIRTGIRIRTETKNRRDKLSRNLLTLARARICQHGWSLILLYPHSHLVWSYYTSLICLSRYHVLDHVLDWFAWTLFLAMHAWPYEELTFSFILLQRLAVFSHCFLATIDAMYCYFMFPCFWLESDVHINNITINNINGSFGLNLCNESLAFCCTNHKSLVAIHLAGWGTR